VAAWVYPTNTGYYRSFVEKQIPGFAYPWSLYSLTLTGNTAKPQFHIAVNNIGYCVVADGAIPLNDWTHIAGTYDGETLRLYVNGILVKTEDSPSGPIDSSNDYLYIGKPPSNAYYYGKSDEVAIYSRALGDSEIAVLASEPVDTATGTGAAYFSASNGTIDDLQAVSAPTPLPRGVQFPHGMFTFEITGLTPGQSVTLTVEFPDPIPTRWVWWKYHNNTWSRIPIGRTADPRIITVTLTDGVYPGDEDSIAGQITDQGGPGSPGSVGWETYPTNRVRVLLPWVALFAAIIAGALIFVRRRRAQN
jgi:hypothetical protein